MDIPENQNIRTEEDALLEWINACPCIEQPILEFLQLRDGIAISRVLKDINPSYFDLDPIEKSEMSVLDCKTNLENIIHSIITYYNKAHHWEMETNFSLDGLFENNITDSLIFILRWVITTILFSEKKNTYLTIILSLSPQTQYFLQCIIQSVKDLLSQDDADYSTISEACSILEESSILPDDDEVFENSRIELRHYYEEETKQLEARISELQQSLTIQHEESEMLRNERDILQQEVTKLERELQIHQQAVAQLEGEGRRLSIQIEANDHSKQDEIKRLQEEIIDLKKKIDIVSDENSKNLKDVEFFKNRQETEKRQYEQWKMENEEEMKQLKNEIQVLQFEKEDLEQSAAKIQVLQQKIEQLKRIESQYIELQLQYSDLEKHLETLQAKQIDFHLQEENKKLRDELNMLKGRFKAVDIEKNELIKENNQLQKNNRELREENENLQKQIQLPQTNQNISLQPQLVSSVFIPQDNTSDLQNKIRSYIIENSELKIQLQQEKKEHEEDLIKKDEEYQTGKQVLEEEYRKSYQENRQLQQQALENQEELKKQKGKVDELQAVISSQQELIQKNEQNLSEKENTIKEWENKYASLEKKCGDYKRKCKSYEDKFEEDKRKRREISFLINVLLVPLFYVDIEKRVMKREREVMKSAVLKTGEYIIGNFASNKLNTSKSAEFLKKSRL